MMLWGSEHYPLQCCDRCVRPCELMVICPIFSPKDWWDALESQLQTGWLQQPRHVLNQTPHFIGRLAEGPSLNRQVFNFCIISGRPMFSHVAAPWVHVWRTGTDQRWAANLFSHGLGVSKILQVQCSQSLQCGNNKQLLNDLKFVDVPRFFWGGKWKKLINQLPPISSSGAEVGNCPCHDQSEQLHKAPNRQSIHHEVSASVMGGMFTFRREKQVPEFRPVDSGPWNDERTEW